MVVEFDVYFVFHNREKNFRRESVYAKSLCSEYEQIEKSEFGK